MKQGDQLLKELAQEQADERIRAEMVENLRRKWGFCSCGLNTKHHLYVRGGCC